jgi:hypothetical protein
MATSTGGSVSTRHATVCSPHAAQVAGAFYIPPQSFSSRHVGSNVRHMHEILNIDKKLINYIYYDKFARRIF